MFTNIWVLFTLFRSWRMWVQVKFNIKWYLWWNHNICENIPKGIVRYNFNYKWSSKTCDILLLNVNSLLWSIWVDIMFIILWTLSVRIGSVFIHSVCMDYEYSWKSVTLRHLFWIVWPMMTRRYSRAVSRARNVAVTFLTYPSDIDAFMLHFNPLPTLFLKNSL